MTPSGFRHRIAPIPRHQVSVDRVRGRAASALWREPERRSGYGLTHRLAARRLRSSRHSCKHHRRNSWSFQPESRRILHTGTWGHGQTSAAHQSLSPVISYRWIGLRYTFAWIAIAAAPAVKWLSYVGRRKQHVPNLTKTCRAPRECTSTGSERDPDRQSRRRSSNTGIGHSEPQDHARHRRAEGSPAFTRRVRRQLRRLPERLRRRARLRQDQRPEY